MSGVKEEGEGGREVGVPITGQWRDPFSDGKFLYLDGSGGYLNLQT